MKNIIKQLDLAIQKYASSQKSEISGQSGCVGHHIVHRANQFLRWDKENIFCCTQAEHNLIHNGVLKIETYASPKRLGSLRDKKLKSLTWKPTDEFYKEQLKKWRLYNG